MARKLKTFVTSVGFFDLAVAVPSMKAAMDAWGVGPNVFHQGFARQTDDPAIIAAATAKPGIVLRRPVGTTEPFREGAELPRGFSLPASGTAAPRAKPGAEPRKAVSHHGTEAKTQRAAVISFEKERAKRAHARAREEAAARRAEEKRARQVEAARQALDDARKEHEARAGKLEQQRAGIERRLKAEDERWDLLRRKLEAALERARKD